MRFLLDTHFILWLPIGGRGINRIARALLTILQTTLFSVPQVCGRSP